MRSGIFIKDNVTRILRRGISAGIGCEINLLPDCSGFLVST